MEGEPSLFSPFADDTTLIADNKSRKRKHRGGKQVQVLMVEINYYCREEIRRHVMLRTTAITGLSKILEYSKATETIMVEAMYGCESWTLKK